MKKSYLFGALVVALSAGCTSSRKADHQTASTNATRSIAQQSSFIRSNTPLFQSYASLNMTLSAPLDRLFSVRARANSENPQEVLNHHVTGSIEFDDANGQKKSLPITIKLRGNTSQELSECPFPKMRIRFNKNQIRGTLFEGNDELNLGTHCGEGGANGARSQGFGRLWHSNSPEREAFLYRMAEILEIPSYKARAVQIRYVNTDNPSSYAQTYTAFFLEDVETIVKRHRGVELRYNRGLRPVQDTERVRYNFRNLEALGPLDAEGLIKVGYFQDMINNTDWSLPMSDRAYGFGMLWNMKVFTHSEGNQVVVMPYDFDLAYMVCENPRWRNRSGSSIYEFFTEDQRRNVRDFLRAKRSDLENATNDLNPTNRDFIRSELDLFYQALRN